jgi:hypothetical protein
MIESRKKDAISVINKDSWCMLFQEFVFIIIKEIN